MKNRKCFFSTFILALFIVIFHIISKTNINFKFNDIGDFSTIFISIMIDAIPFVILGSFVSAIIQIYISEDNIKRIIPKNEILGYFEMALIGFIFPICECAIVPIGRRLIKKGLSVGLGVTFMLAVPIVNPIVILSTYYAFYDMHEMVLLRTVGGFCVAILIGVIIDKIQDKDKVILTNYMENDILCNCGCNNLSYGNESKIKLIINHTSREFLDITKYLIFGALISSGFQIITNHADFTSISNNKIMTILFMMFLGFSLSLCSEADAFVGKSLIYSNSLSGLAGFLILGPMLDLKNLIILYGSFRKNFVFKLSLVTISCVFLICLLFMICGF